MALQSMKKLVLQMSKEMLEPHKSVLELDKLAEVNMPEPEVCKLELVVYKLEPEPDKLELGMLELDKLELSKLELGKQHKFQLLLLAAFCSSCVQ